MPSTTILDVIVYTNKRVGERWTESVTTESRPEATDTPNTAELTCRNGQLHGRRREHVHSAGTRGHEEWPQNPRRRSPCGVTLKSVTRSDRGV